MRRTVFKYLMLYIYAKSSNSITSHPPRIWSHRKKDQNNRKTCCLSCIMHVHIHAHAVSNVAARTHTKIGVAFCLWLDLCLRRQHAVKTNIHHTNRTCALDVCCPFGGGGAVAFRRFDPVLGDFNDAQWEFQCYADRNIYPYRFDRIGCK